MPITRVQENGGGSSSAGFSADLNNPPTPGNYLVLHVNTRSTAITVGSGFAVINTVGSTNVHSTYGKWSDGSEQVVQITIPSGNQSAWAYEELVGVDPLTPVRATAGNDNTATVGSVSSGTTDASPQIGDHAIGSFASRSDVADQAFTNGFVFDLNYRNADATVAELTTAKKELTAAGSAETTMSWTPNAVTRGLMLVLAASGDVPVTQKMNVYDGAQFVPGTPKVWDGAQWVEAVPKVWDGGAWVGG